MKKLSLYIMSILAVGLMTACTEDFNEGVFPQTNEQEDLQSYEGLVVETGADFKADLDLSAKAAADTLYVITTKDAPAMNPYSAMDYVLEVSNTEGFDKKVELEAATGYVLVDELNTAFRTLFGKSPKQRDMYVRFRAYISEGEARVRCGEFVGSSVVKVTPIPMDLPTIESTYYLIGDVAGGWDADHLLKLSHSDADVYDDPVFTITFQTPKDKSYFKIVPESAIPALSGDWAGVMGCEVDGSIDLEGKIVSVNPQAIQIEKQQWVRVKLNMMDLQYTIELLGEVSPYMWVPGNHQGWSPATAPQLYSATMNMIYTGHLYLDGGFKVNETPDPAWVGDHGYDYFTTKSPNITSSSDNNLVVDPSFYYLTVDMNTSTINAVKAEWGLIGSATAGGWDTSTAMTYDKATNCWSVTTDMVKGEFKFRANNSWDINMGGTVGKLIFNDSNNLTLDDAGNYTIKLYLSNDDASYCTLTKN
ncbi:SusF/SusE family outer membrane protein [Bacteroides sp.]|uniref:SusF/SusE family outer membrane protein n=1 Tax=Bacteroides sp. TaxID=29523 RepID=UPI002635C984|nr:SusF/SusE family outer membrane protein [Bacteroides sp.]